ncbi:MAG TPA: SUMF1/EgtB/PvdO family nonheme iron enzyme, partial [Roseiflexaceae bacterium]|nr:SUMF1/EgtB/PvdO family nonheme iron enzyme [Roseiflexaceae bacterium]
AAPESDRLVSVAPSAVAQTHAEAAAPAQAAASTQAAAPAGAVAPRPGGRAPIIAGVAVALLVLLAGATYAAGLWPAGRAAPSPTAPPATPGATTASGVTTAPGVTSAPTVAPTIAGATAAPAQPTEAPTVPPLPEPAGVIALEEDFNSGGERTGLDDRVQDTEFSRGFHPPGVYHFLATTPGETRWAVLPRQLVGDFSMQLEVWDNSDEFVGTVAQGVIFRVRDAAHFYAFLLDPRSGRYTVRKQDGTGAWSDIIPWKDSALIKRGAEHNLIRLDAAGENFTIYLNGQQLDTFSDGSYRSGMLGMLIANGDAAKPHMHFDNLVIWSADPRPPDAGLPPARDTPAGAMVLIPGGEFVLGSNDRRDETPHVVDLPSFYIDRTEVTNAAYAACVGDGVCTPQDPPSSQTHPNYATQEEFANFPALHVSWEQANQYCTWAGKRLPTEAEWEKAASWDSAERVKRAWPFGDQFDPVRLNSEEAGQGDTTAVDAHDPELNGTFDMAGNVSEWTSTLYRPYPYDPSDGREDPAAAGDRVFRGGSWAQTHGKARGALRQFAPPDYVNREIGFRCALTP